MNSKKILISMFFILVTVAVVIMIYSHGIFDKLELYPLAHSPISIQEGDKVFFYKEGFAITGEYTSFFDNRGKQTTSPFKFDEDENHQNFAITAITTNYMLVNGKTIFKIDYPDLEEIFTIETSAIAMEEFGKYLLLILEDEEDNIKPYFLDVDSGVFSDLAIDDTLYYMDADHDITNSSLSILTLDVEGSFPSPRILHYDKDLSLYGIISSVDQVYYRIFRFPSNILLIGNHELVCYNIEGNIEWKIENNSIDVAQAARNDSGLLLYFDNRIEEDEQQESFNGIYIDNEGEPQYINLPPLLSKIAPYKDKFLAIQYAKNILIIDKDGKVGQEFSVDDDIEDIYWNPYQPDDFLIIKQDKTLQIYSTKQEDSLK